MTRAKKMDNKIWFIYIVICIVAICLILGALTDFVDPCGSTVCGSTVIEHQRSYEATAAEGERLLDIQLTAQAEENEK